MPNASTIRAEEGIDNYKSKKLSVAASVFSIVELLTPILEGCAAYDLLCHLPRVNSTFKYIIDNNEYIQQRLFFKPFIKNGAVRLVTEFEINPFLKYLSIRPGTKVKRGCDWNLGPGPFTQDFIDYGYESDAMSRQIAPDKVMTYLEIDWDKIFKDERFLREGASWKRMLPVQPPPREIWNFADDDTVGTEIRPRSVKVLGKTWNNVKFRKWHPLCSRLRTFLRSCERYGIVVMTTMEFIEHKTGENADLYINNNGYRLYHWPRDEE